MSERAMPTGTGRAHINETEPRTTMGGDPMVWVHTRRFTIDVIVPPAYRDEVMDIGHTLAAALNAATVAADMGFDPIGAIQAVEKMLIALMAAQQDCRCGYCTGDVDADECEIEHALSAARTRQEVTP